MTEEEVKTIKDAWDRIKGFAFSGDELEWHEYAQAPNSAIENKEVLTFKKSKYWIYNTPRHFVVRIECKGIVLDEYRGGYR